MFRNKAIKLIITAVIICLVIFAAWYFRTNEKVTPVTTPSTTPETDVEKGDIKVENSGACITKLKRICHILSEGKETAFLDFSFTVSPDCRKAAYFLKDKTAEFIVVNDKKGKEYNINPITGDIVFSPDSNRIAYIARKGTKKIAVIDGVEGQEYDNIFRDAVVFSPDSKRAAYVAKKGDSEVAIIDGKEGGDYAFILKGYVFFSPDSQTAAYCADKEKIWHKKRVLVMNGNEIWDKGANIVRGRIFFSPDSKRLAYMAREGLKMYAVVDGKKQKSFEASPFLDESSILDWDNFIKQMASHNSPKTEQLWKYLDEGTRKIVSDFKPGQSPDEKTKEAVIAGLNNVIKIKEFYQPEIFSDVKLDEKYRDILSLGLAMKPMPKLKEEFLNRLMIEATFPKEIEKSRVYYPKHNMTFSPDSRHLAYEARSGRNWVMTLDEKEGKIYEDIGPPEFSPDSSHLAYVARQGDKQFVVTDEKEGKKYNIINSTPTFSADGKHLAYSAKESDGQFAIIDGKEGKKYGELLVNLTIFRTDSKQVVNKAVGEKEYKEEINKWKAAGRVRKTDMRAVAFSPDGSRTAYAVRGEGKEFVVIDGKEGTKYEKIILLPIFSPDGKFVVYAARDKNKEFIVINDQKLKEFDSVINRGDGRIIFDSAGSFHYLAMIAHDVYLVEESIKEKGAKTDS